MTHQQGRVLDPSEGQMVKSIYLYIPKYLYYIICILFNYNHMGGLNYVLYIGDLWRPATRTLYPTLLV